MKVYFTCNLLACLLLCSIIAHANDDITIAYIDQYKHIAVAEMHRTGIPASITMAQAIHESNSGRSYLARHGNAHFGIKCNNGWDGPTVHREDDDYKNGLLVKSCFRAYPSAHESFYDHSEFLANPHSRRYGFLFDLGEKDYKAWAKGLRKAGYATDPKYPSKLIHIIEKYELYLLDEMPPNGAQKPLLAAVTNAKKHKKNNEPKIITNNQKESATSKTRNTSKTHKRNRRRTADRHTAKVDFHTVGKGETMASISKRYGIDLKKLYVQNRMPFGSEPKRGEELAIDHFIHFKQKPKFQNAVANEQNGNNQMWSKTITIGS